jgi:HTH-type transcriptional repressor of NAD biosynthesis genes
VEEEFANYDVLTKSPVPKIDQKKFGLTLGKFLPLHKGHELLLKVALENVDVLFVLIGTTPDDPFSFELRQSWVYLALQKQLCPPSFKQVIVINQPELDKNASKDEDGTITDEGYWQDWLDSTLDVLGVANYKRIKYVFTSDLYGERIAKELAARWVPVDPDREMKSISGTKVRENFYSMFKTLPEYTKATLVKTVAIIGPESCGKSTMITKLSQKYDTLPEYGRILSVNKKNNLDREDFRIIQRTQDLLIRQTKENANYPIIVSDTEALVTALYADIWMPDEDNSEFYEFARNQKIDKYIVLSPSVPWVQDGFRVMSHDMDRWAFFYKLVAKLTEWKKDYELITNSIFHQRQADAEHIIEGMIPKPKY